MVTDASLQSLLWEPNAENVTKNFQLISIKIHKSLLTLQKYQYNVLNLLSVSTVSKFLDIIYLLSPKGKLISINITHSLQENF